MSGVFFSVAARPHSISSPNRRPVNDDDDSNGSASTSSSVLDSIIPTVLAAEGAAAAGRRKRNAVSISSFNGNTSDDGKQREMERERESF